MLKSYLLVILLVGLFAGCESQNVVEKVGGLPGILDIEIQDNDSKFGEVLTGEVYDKTFTLTNNGGFEISKMAVTGPSITSQLQFKGGSYPGSGGDCGNSILPGNSCSIVVSFTSEEKIAIKQIMTIDYHDGINKQQKKLPLDVHAATVGTIEIAQGVYLTPEDVFSNKDSIISFPTVSIGKKVELTLSLTNLGERDSYLKDIPELREGMSYIGGQFPGNGGTCERAIKSQQVCQIRMALEGVTIGQINEPLDFGHHNGIELIPLLVPTFTDTIDERANILVNGPLITDFGDVPTNFAKIGTIYLVNNTVLDATNVTMNISNNSGSIRFTGGSYPGTNGTCTTTVSALTPCQLEVEILSNSDGVKNEQLSISFNDNHIKTPLDVNKDYPLVAKIVPPGKLTLIPERSIPSVSPENFGARPVETEENRVFAFENTGAFPASGINVELINNPSGVFELVNGGSCGTSKSFLQKEEICTIRIKGGSNVTGVYSADIRITYDNGTNGGAPLTEEIVSLDASYVDISRLTYVPLDNIDFGDILNGATSVTRIVTLENQLQGTATNMSFNFADLASTDFNLVSNSCTTTLNGGESCQLEFNITPGSAGNKFFSLRLDFEDLLGPQSRNLTLRANSRDSADITITDQLGTPISAVNFGDAPVGQLITLPIIIRNIGGLTASNITPSISGSNFTIHSSGECSGTANFSVIGGESCVIELGFNPSGIGNFSETFSISYNDGAGLQTKNYNITGDGANVGMVKILGAERYTVYDLGQTIATVPATYTLNVQNVGSADANLFSLNGVSGDFSYGTNNCPDPIPAGATCEFELIYSPTQQGIGHQVISYTYESGLSQKSFQFEVTAYALRPADIQIGFQGPTAPNLYDFGDVPFLTTRYLTMTTTNQGAASADNFNVEIDQGSLTSYNIVSTDCPTGGSLVGGGSCRTVIEYSPEDQSQHNGEFRVNYNGYGNQTLPVTTIIRGVGIDPLANFNGWYQIKAVTDDTESSIELRWDQATPEDLTLTIDGYKVYHSVDVPLPKDLSDVEAFLVKTISGDNFTLREFSLNSLTPNSLHYISVKPTYLGKTMNTTSNVNTLIIPTPPTNMALIHPYMINTNFCVNMGMIPDLNEDFGCSYSGLGSENDLFKKVDLLYMDRYEVRHDGDKYVSEAGVIPDEFTNQLVASGACTSQESFTFQSQSIQKNLISRSEFVAASAWQPHLTLGDISNIEKGLGANDCMVEQSAAGMTGSKSRCESQFGVFDLIGNLWEWNSDQVNNSVGWSSSVDTSNDELFGLNMGGLFPNEVNQLPCFNFSHGLALNFTPQVCPDGIEIDGNEHLFGNNYYFPPLTTGIKPVRSGGSVGPEGGFASRKAGRWVGDFNTSLSGNTEYSGARCSFSIEAPIY